MPISVRWDDDARSIIRHIFDGTWTWAEYRAIIDQSNGLVNTVSHRIDVIADLCNSGPLPKQNAFPTLKYMASQAPNDASGLFVVVGGGIFVEILGATFKRAYHGQGARVAFCDTIEEARTLIQKDRERTGTAT